MIKKVIFWSVLIGGLIFLQSQVRGLEKMLNERRELAFKNGELLICDRQANFGSPLLISKQHWKRKGSYYINESLSRVIDIHKCSPFE